MNDRRRESRKRRSTAFRDGWTAWRRASRNPAAPRNAVSPWEAGAPRSAASRWEVAANPWLGAIARCSRTGSSNPSPSRRESTANLTAEDVTGQHEHPRRAHRRQDRRQTPGESHPHHGRCCVRRTYRTLSSTVTGGASTLRNSIGIHQLLPAPRSLVHTLSGASQRRRAVPCLRLCLLRPSNPQPSRMASAHP
jgi:hypothetical protein